MNLKISEGLFDSDEFWGLIGLRWRLAFSKHIYVPDFCMQMAALVFQIA